MKPNDTVMIYTGDNPEGQAKLIEIIEKYDKYEIWKVEFIDSPGMIYERLIMK